MVSIDDVIVVRIFGAVRVIAEGEHQPTSPLLRALLGSLAVAYPQPVSAVVLISRTWAEDMPQKPAGTLQLSIWKLRRWLGGVCGNGAIDVERTAAGYRLVLATGTTDLAVFRRLIHRAGSVPGEDAFRTLACALELSAGNALDDVPPDRMDASVVDGLAMERRAAARHCAQLGVAVDPAAGLLIATRLCAEDPYDEDAHATLAEALAVTGAHVRALAELDALRRRLSTDWGIEPGARFRQVRDWVLLQSGTSEQVPPCTHGEATRVHERQIRNLTSEIEMLKARMAALVKESAGK